MEKITEVIAEAARRAERGEPFAMVTVTGVSGAAPQRIGARMLVDPAGAVFGTVGGGGVEKYAIGKALESLTLGSVQTIEMNLNDPEAEQTGSICGGTMTMLIEPFGAGPRLLLFGAGHVALPTARLAAQVGFRVELFDSRSQWANAERFPGMKTHVGDYGELAKSLKLTGRDFIAIMTHSHNEDYKILANLIRRSWFYLGVIGSKKKSVEIRRRLEGDGFTPEEIARITCPIGIPIGSRTPEEVAVSIAAELIKLKKEWSGGK